MTLHCKFHYLALPARRGATEDQLNKQEITFSLYSPWLPALTMVPRSWELNRHLHKINNSLAFSPSHWGLFRTLELSNVCWRGWGCWKQIKNGLMCQRGSQHLNRGSAANKCTCSIPEINDKVPAELMEGGHSLHLFLGMLPCPGASLFWDGWEWSP